LTKVRFALNGVKRTRSFSTVTQLGKIAYYETTLWPLWHLQHFWELWQNVFKPRNLSIHLFGNLHFNWLNMNTLIFL